MNKFLIFTILLVSSFGRIQACGYSPFGEDIRYSICKPEYFNYKHYKSFYYTAELWGYDFDEYPEKYKIVDSNILDWYNFTHKKVAIEDIEEFNFKLLFTDVNPNSDNKFIQYLYQNNEKEAIKYLKIAKGCELTNDADDAWERNETVNNGRRARLLNKMLRYIDEEKNLYFKRKYAFLTIRLGHYSGNREVVKDVFESNFKNTKKDYLYYWSLFFYTFTKSNPGYMVDVADLMANSPEKKHASYYFFHENFKVEEALKYAKSKTDIANIYAYASVQKRDQALDYIKEIYANSPKSEILGFLLLRELNKIEDWVYTPYYSNYSPSIDYQNFWDSEENNISTQTLRARSENDRLYAKKVLDFVNSINSSKIQNPIVWKTVAINLEFITRNYKDCLKKIALFEKEYKTEKVFEEIEKIKALCIMADQENGRAVIKPELEETILKYKADARFIFALGRELEFKGNLTDGIALISLIEESESIDGGFNSYDVEWQGNRIKSSSNLKEFKRYFDYLDFVYTAKAVQKILDKTEDPGLTDFQKRIYAVILKDKNSLKDLLGTKYIRESQLNNALKTFKTLDKKYWDDNYNAWERGEYGDNYVFDQNPFYDLKHTASFIPHTEKYLVTKLSVTEHLVKYSRLANNPKTADRSYYYFLIANCYYNMSDYGNSWMMRRYTSRNLYYGDEYQNESYIDEIEYRNKLKAIANYKLAFKNAKTNKFKALCLRMMDFVEHQEYSNSERVKKEFPEFASDLSGCVNLEAYFKARK
ncbi:hypothetical protein ACFFLS_06910 [Flavobacterium procerum]|uniref:Tetratricopeptide repeat protein n=1 Tax=Flavobacterium procerum TaxID=1455569 RepID=A0ABV6BMU0_9FLAO